MTILNAWLKPFLNDIILKRASISGVEKEKDC